MGLDQSGGWAFAFETEIVPALEKIIGEATSSASTGARSSAGAPANGGARGDRGEDWYDSNDMFPFGKYGPEKGNPKTFGEVPSHYFEWLGDQSWISEWPGVLRYINGEAPPPRGQEPAPAAPAEEDPEAGCPF